MTIEHVKKVYYTNENGNFKRKPGKEYAENVTSEFYENFIRSITFFNGFMGGTCHAENAYTAAGYIPVKVVTISPDKSEKHVDTFTFHFDY